MSADPRPFSSASVALPEFKAGQVWDTAMRSLRIVKVTSALIRYEVVSETGVGQCYEADPKTFAAATRGSTPR